MKNDRVPKLRTTLSEAHMKLSYAFFSKDYKLKMACIGKLYYAYISVNLGIRE